MSSFRHLKTRLPKQHTKEPAKESAKPVIPFPNIITQVNKEDDKNFRLLDLLNIRKCWSFLWRCLPTKKPQQFTHIVEAPQGLLEPQLSQFKGKKTLVLDLDETLVHSTFEPVQNPDLVLPVRIQGVTYNINVMIRPGTEEFLAKVGEMFEVVVFTASLSEYAEPLVRLLDTTNAVSYLLYRQHCTPMNGVYVKDLALIGRDLKNIILIDNSPNSFLFQPENAYHIKNFFDDKKDRELTRLSSFLEHIVDVSDVRPIEEFRKKFDPPHSHSFMKFLKLHHNDSVDLESSSIHHHVNDPSKPIGKKKEEREKSYNAETEPDLRRNDKGERLPKALSSERNKDKARQYANYYSKAIPLTERIVVNDRLIPQTLDSSEDLELPSPKESDALIYHKEQEALLQQNESKENKEKPKIPPFANTTVFATNNFVTVDDPTLQGHKVEDVRFLTGVDNLNSPLGKQIKITLDNQMEVRC